MVGNSDIENNFLQSLLLCDGQGFSNNLSNNMKLSKTYLSKIVQSEEFLSGILAPLV